MKKTITFLTLLFFISCGSGRSFQRFFNQHKNDVGVTAFQVPNFMRALLRNISPEKNGVFKNIDDFKFITFTNISQQKQSDLIDEMNAVTAAKFTDIFRRNEQERTKILSVKEDGDVVSQAIIFNSTLAKTTVFYLKGRFDPNKLKQLAESDDLNTIPSKLLQNNLLNPNFNPNNK